MLEMTKSVQAAILAHAAKEAPQECCGLIVQAGGKQLYRPCGNVAADPSARFEIAPPDWIEVSDQGEVCAIVHSHPQGEPWLSGADRQMQVANGLPWVLAVSGSLKQLFSRPTPFPKGNPHENHPSSLPFYRTLCMFRKKASPTSRYAFSD